MISNYLVRKRHREVCEEIKKLAEKKHEMQAILNSLSLTANQKKKPHLLDERTQLVRERCVNEIKELDEKFAPLQAERKRLADLWDSQKNNFLRQVFKDVLTTEQMAEISMEAERRALGEGECMLSFNFKRHDEFKNDYYKYKDIAKEQIDTMINFRTTLTRIIEEGCSKFGDAEFLKVMSPLNNMILPINELKKIKQKHLL